MVKINTYRNTECLRFLELVKELPTKCGKYMNPYLQSKGDQVLE